MNTIEMGANRQRTLEHASDPAIAAADPAPAFAQVDAIRSHAFARMPAAGVPDAAAREWALADIEGLKSINEPKDRKLPLSLMAMNMLENNHYHMTLAEKSPSVEAEVTEIGVAEVRQRTRLLDGHRKQLDREQRDKDAAERLFKDLDARMAKADMQRRGWRDRNDLGPILEDLERLAGKSLAMARTLWEKATMGDADKPRFLNEAERFLKDEPESAAPGSAVRSTKESAARDQTAAKDTDAQDGVNQDAQLALRKRYLVEGHKYYFRHGANDLAFEDKGKRLATEHDDPAVAQSMVDLAAAKEWTAIKVKGSAEFKRQVWLAASLRGLQVEGYHPSKLDMAKLDESNERAKVRSANEIEKKLRREIPVEQEASMPLVGKKRKESEKATAESQPQLTKQQRLAIDTLKELLRARGDSEVAIDMAAAVASDRFQHKRVYVGKMLEHGRAPYRNAPENDESYYVKLQTAEGERTVWGIDLSRALEANPANQGDDIVLTTQGKKTVTVQSKELDELGQATGKTIHAEAERNIWEVNKLDKMRDAAKQHLQRTAKLSEKMESMQPVINMYDAEAPRRQERHNVQTKDPAPSRGKAPPAPAR
jgi:hypothetical protein